MRPGGSGRGTVSPPIRGGKFSSSQHLNFWTVSVIPRGPANAVEYLGSPRLRRFLHDHGDDGVKYFADGSAPIGPALVGTRRGDHHGCIGLEQQQIAVAIEPEIDSTIVEAEGVPDLFKRRHCLVS